MCVCVCVCSILTFKIVFESDDGVYLCSKFKYPCSTDHCYLASLFKIEHSATRHRA